MEYADEGDIQSNFIMKKNYKKIFEGKKILSIFIQMRKGLNKLCNKKIIYRDVKLEIYFWWKMV